MDVIIQELAKRAQAVEDGDKYALELAVELKKIENEIKALKGQINEAAYYEIQDYPKCKAEAFGAKIELRSKAGRWDFSKIDRWNEAKRELKEIEEASKDAYKAYMKGQVIYDSEGVEVDRGDFTTGGEAIFITLSK